MSIKQLLFVKFGFLALFLGSLLKNTECAFAVGNSSTGNVEAGRGSHSAVGSKGPGGGASGSTEFTIPFTVVSPDGSEVHHPSRPVTPGERASVGSPRRRGSTDHFKTKAVPAMTRGGGKPVGGGR
jgi:hypothetical protein